MGPVRRASATVLSALRQALASALRTATARRATPREATRGEEGVAFRATDGRCGPGTNQTQRQPQRRALRAILGRIVPRFVRLTIESRAKGGLASIAGVAVTHGTACRHRPLVCPTARVQRASPVHPASCVGGCVRGVVRSNARAGPGQLGSRRASDAKKRKACFERGGVDDVARAAFARPRRLERDARHAGIALAFVPSANPAARGALRHTESCRDLFDAHRALTVPRWT